MDFDKLKQKAQEVYEQRGGSEAAKADGGELKDIFEGEGSLADKAKAAAQALKEPGAHHDSDANQRPGDASVTPREPQAASEPAAPLPPRPDRP